MNKQKHTPGPWKCNPHDRAHNFKILPAVYDTPVSTDEALANARLIAAAPELLETAKRIRQSLLDMDITRGTAHALELSKLDYVIRKAEGEE